MADYIKRDDIFDVINIGRSEYPECGSAFDGMETEVRHIPSADVAEVKRGRWEIVWLGYSNTYKCSICKFKYNHTDNFCPNCGADMER